MAGLELVTQTSFTSVTELTIDNCFSATYRNYVAQLFIDTSTVYNQGAEIRYRSGGTDNTDNEYYRQDFRVDGTGQTAARVQDTKGFCFRTGDTGANAAVLYFYNPAVASGTMLRTMVADLAGLSDDIEHEEYTVRHNVASAFDGFKFLFGASFTGTLELYGYGLS